MLGLKAFFGIGALRSSTKALASEGVVDGGLGSLVLLIFGEQIADIGFGFGEFQLVHAFARVPVQKGLALKHGRKLRDGE